MALNNLSKLFLVVAFTAILNAEEELKDFEFISDDDSGETMIAEESRSYQTIVKPPVTIIKPKGVTNSHRPQYDIDSFEVGYMQEQLKGFKETPKRSLIDPFEEALASKRLRASESSTKPFLSVSKVERIKLALQRALQRKDMDRFAQIVPIVRAMTPSQREALAELVARQDAMPAHPTNLSYSKVRSMFGKTANTSDLMLPILIDMANMIRRAARSRKEAREVKQHLQPQMQRRSYSEDEYIYLDDEPFDTSYENLDTTTTTAISTTRTTQATTQPPFLRYRRKQVDNTKSVNETTKKHIDNTYRDNNRTNNSNITQVQEKNTKHNGITTIDPAEIKKIKASIINETTSLKSTRPLPSALRLRSLLSSTTTLSPSPASESKATNLVYDNVTIDLNAESTSHSMATDSPVAEKLRAPNRFNLDRKTAIRRGNYPKPVSTRRTTAEPTITPIKRRPIALRKIPPASSDQSKCELFTNTLCLHAEDYPTEAIVNSIRRNKAQAGALLADFKDPGEGAVDGVTAEQEAKYTAEHYLMSNRRGDTASRDFASAGEAGFMCPSTVKYARPQRARATSGQWKYIVNTGEHTQTLRLEKCLKPKEACTYLTDNFKSKCVQVYNYHRLLTWDQQNGLHMDIFKVPTCCSCHIEGYSVSFPPLGHRVHETSSEPFPEDISSEHGNHAFEAIQSSNQRPSLSKSPSSSFSHNKQLDFNTFPDSHNLIAGSPFSSSKVLENDEYSTRNIASHPVDSYGNTYFPDTFEQASSIKSVKRPLPTKLHSGLTASDSMSLPSYLEPPTPSAPVSFSFGKDSGKPFNKRRPLRPNRRPMIKKVSAGPDDLISSGTSAIETTGGLESLEDFNDNIDDIDKLNYGTNKRGNNAPKLTGLQGGRVEINTQKKSNSNEDTLSNSGKKVNYNYHPIIDFFGSVKENENTSIDREDIEPTYVPSSESEWKPINKLPSRNNN